MCGGGVGQGGGGVWSRGVPVGVVTGWMCTNNWSYCENAKNSGGPVKGGGVLVKGGGSGRGWCQGGCVQRIEVIVKMQKKVGGGGPVGGWGSGRGGGGGQGGCVQRTN